MKKQINSGKPVLDVYQEKSKQYEYHPADCPNCTRTRIGNGGKFHLSKAISNIFPEYFARPTATHDIAKLLDLNMGETTILEQKRSKEDDDLRKRHGKIIATETDNRLILYTVIDFFEPEKK